MSSKISFRTFSALAQPSRCRLLPATPSCIAASSQCQHLSTSSVQRQGSDSAPALKPRWQSTPSAMRAPVRSRPRPFYFRVNEDPARLDEVYTRVLGNRGSQMLTEDVKWLAVTHKSFDHGRRGFNDRLAFLGKLIVELQTSLAVIHSPSGAQASTAEPSRDQYGRTPFEHPALKGLESINKAQDIDKDQLAQLGERYGLASVIRWKPKKIDNLKGSGIETVLAQSIYAIVGAVALQKGGEVANRVVRERILMPLGVLS